VLKRLAIWLKWVLWEKREFTRYAFDKMVERRKSGAACQVRAEDASLGLLRKLCKKAGVQLYSVTDMNKGRTYYTLFTASDLRMQQIKGQDQTELLPTAGPNSALRTL
jgi:hypothetical protein